MTPVPLIDVSGSPTGYGTAYGVAASRAIAANLDLYLGRFAIEAGLDTAAVRIAGNRFRDLTAIYAPRVSQALDGVAEGAGVESSLIYALNARSELLAPARVRTAPHASPPDGADGACTSVGVLGGHTADGHLLLGQNWDWHPEQRDEMLLLRTTDERGLTVLALCEAGMLAKTGLNSAGIGVCVNMLGSDRDGVGGVGDLGAEVGLPYHVLLRAALETDSLGNALKAVVRPPRNCSINMIIGQTDEVISVELAPGDAGWLHPVDGYVTHANHFESGIPLYDTIKNWGGSSLFRSARARRLLAPAAAGRKVTPEDLMALFRDHTGYPQAICRHVDERDAPADRTETVYSVLLDLDAKRLAIAAGPPCGHEYDWLDL